MISFKQFLTEEKRDLIAFLRKNCREACEDALQSSNFLWRGMALKDDDTFSTPGNSWLVVGSIITVRQNRKPRDTPDWAHKAVDDFFEKEFGRRLRSTSLFCNNSKVPAEAYGKPHIVLPIGNYDIFWSDRVGDLTTDLFPDLESGEDSGLAGGMKYWIKEKIPLADVTREMELKVIDKILERAEYNKGPNVAALKRGVGELMVQCHSYLAIPIESSRYYNQHDIETWIYDALSE